MEVTTKNITPVTVETEVVPVKFSDDAGKPEDDIVIVKLSRNQQIDFSLLAKKGIGKQHAKWSPVATCIMHKQPIVEID